MVPLSSRLITSGTHQGELAAACSAELELGSSFSLYGGGESTGGTEVVTGGVVVRWCGPPADCLRASSGGGTNILAPGRSGAFHGGSQPAGRLSTG